MFDKTLALVDFLNLGLVEIKSDYREACPREFDSKRKAYVSQPDYPDSGLSVFQFSQQLYRECIFQYSFSLDKLKMRIFQLIRYLSIPFRARIGQKAVSLVLIAPPNRVLYNISYQ